MIPDEQLRARVLALNDTEQDSLTNIVRAGENEHQYFVLVLMVREYEGNTYLNERYVALSKHDPEEDTWMKNGINRRSTGQVNDTATALARAYQSIANRDSDDIASGRTPVTEV